jgi:tetratricopeptide (TPR) repeat protein
MEWVRTIEEQIKQIESKISDEKKINRITDDLKKSVSKFKECLLRKERGKLYLVVGNGKEAIEDFKKVLKIKNEASYADTVIAESDVIFDIGKGYILQGLFEKGLVHIRKVLTKDIMEEKQIEFRWSYFEALSKIGYRPREIELVLKELAESGKKIGNLKLQLDALNKLQACYKAIRNYNKMANISEEIRKIEKSMNFVESIEIDDSSKFAQTKSVRHNQKAVQAIVFDI